MLCRAVARWHKWHELPVDGTQIYARLTGHLVVGGQARLTWLGGIIMWRVG